MRCIECNHVLIKPHPNHANVGLGRCSQESFAAFYSLTKTHDCDKFKQAEKSAIKLRIDWYDKKFGKKL